MGAPVPDDPAPDVQVILSAGARRFASRVHYDEERPALGEVAYLALAPAERVTVEVIDVDGDESEPIGKGAFAVPAGGPVAPLAFGAVKRLEIALRPVERAEERFVVTAAGSLETPLYLFAGEAVRVTAADGTMCAGSACAGPDGAHPGSALGQLAPELAVGRLSAALGPTGETAVPGARVRASRDDYLVLSLVTAPSLELAGSYRVEVVVEP
jgi:hypothetical protein